MPRRAEAQPYYGDALAGVPLAQFTPRLFRERRGLVESTVLYVLGIAAAIAALILLGLFLVLAFMFASQPSLAEQITVPRACAAVAEQYGMTAPAKMDRAEIIQHLNSVDVIAIGALVPAVQRCRDALKLELKK